MHEALTGRDSHTVGAFALVGGAASAQQRVQVHLCCVLGSYVQSGVGKLRLPLVAGIIQPVSHDQQDKLCF